MTNMFVRIIFATIMSLAVLSEHFVSACDPDAANPSCKGICNALEKVGCLEEDMYGHGGYTYDCTSSNACEKLCALESEKGCGYRRALRGDADHQE